ncbi:MAG: CDC27 family protein [Terriglobales bacterium]
MVTTPDCTFRQESQLPVSARSVRPARASALAVSLMFALSMVAAATGLPLVAPSGSHPTAATLHRAGQLIEWGRWKEARSLVQEQLAKSPKDAELLAYDAHIQIGFGHDAAALKEARRAVKLDPTCALCHLYLGEALGQKAKRESKVFALIQVGKIKRQLTLASRYGPDLGDVHWGWIRFNLQVPPVAGGNVKDAFAQARALGRIDPVDGLIAQATIDLALGRPGAAMAAYQQAAGQYPNDPRAIFEVGLTLFNRQQYARAAGYLRRARDLQPQSTLYAGYYAATLIHLRQHQRARHVIAATQPLHPDSRLADYLAAKALKSVGQDYAWARRLVSAYLAAAPEPNQPTVHQARELLASLG